jgi:iron complex transport system ATP-binding protein
VILNARGLTVRYRGTGKAALSEVDLSLTRGELVAVVGPNGSGKTTLLRVCTGVLEPVAGSVEISGRALGRWTPGELARTIAVVPQREEILFPLRVSETVMLGRYAWLGPWTEPGPADRAAVQEAMDRCDVSTLGDRLVDSLSGGEWQRVRVARALAQQPEALLLDEPTAALDVRHEMEVFELVRSLVDAGLAALVITHHLNLAARYADRMLLLSGGRVVARGTPADVLARETLSAVFEWPVAVTSWCDGSPQVIPLRPGEAP